MIEHQEAEILAWEVNPNLNPNMKIGLIAHIYHVLTVYSTFGFQMNPLAKIDTNRANLIPYFLGSHYSALDGWPKLNYSALSGKNLIIQH